jgi:GrpB-like predicted nucleotidyltransferase (UPF0157 family)
VVAIDLQPSSLEYPTIFADESDRIRRALGGLGVDVHHTGSTSVPGLRAKPIIDITMGVPDSTDEDAYRPRLVDAGYEFLVREPEWFEHRLFKRVEPRVNLHVFTIGSSEIDRMLLFRDHLRVDEADRALYEATKISLARQDWETVQSYADAKTEVVEAILARANAHRGIS